MPDWGRGSTRRATGAAGDRAAAGSALAFTNDLHLLFRTQVRLLDIGTYLVLESAFGPAFWLHTVYSYLLTGSGAFLLLRTFVRMPRIIGGRPARCWWQSAPHGSGTSST